jgi:hypothetical protein
VKEICESETDPLIPFSFGLREKINNSYRAMTPGELHVTWNPPNQPNGNVTHYEVYWRRRELDPRSYAPRDYCNNREYYV